MERINWIIKHPLYISFYKQLEELEKDRIFCCHQMPHLLDVARIAYIRNLKEQLGLEKSVIYAASILHDIGKGRQYTENIPHETASAEIAEKILSDMPEEIAFTSDEQIMILSAIQNHRRPIADAAVLDKLLYESDKASRNCFCCPASDECNWSADKKNKEILY